MCMWGHMFVNKIMNVVRFIVLQTLNHNILFRSRQMFFCDQLRRWSIAEFKAGCQRARDMPDPIPPVVWTI